MKTLILLCVAILFIGCEDDNSGKPEMPPQPTIPATSTSVAPPPTTIYPGEPICPQPGLGSYKCYDWQPCAGIFYSREEAIEALTDNDPSGCSKLDDEIVKHGFGPCSVCIGWKSNEMKAMSKQMSFEEVLKARDGKTKE